MKAMEKTESILQLPTAQRVCDGKAASVEPRELTQAKNQTTTTKFFMDGIGLWTKVEGTSLFECCYFAISIVHD